MARSKFKKFRDPNKPKPYLNSYLLFFMDARPSILEKSPKMSFSKVGKEVGRRWRALPASAKQKYVDRANVGKKRYQSRLAHYDAPSQEELFEMFGVRPKRFITPYGYYMKKNYGKILRRNPSLDFDVLSRRLAKQWGDLSEEERMPYIERFVLDWRRWKREMHLYRGGHFRHASDSCCHCCQGTATRMSRPPWIKKSSLHDCQTCDKVKEEHHDGHHAKL